MQKYKVLIDGYFFGRPSGFGRVIAELCRALGQMASEDRIIVAIPDNVDESELPAYDNIEWHRLPKRNFIVWEQVSIPRLAKQLGCDVIHFPYNTTAAFTYGIKTVVTVHDLLFLKSEPPPATLKAFIAEEYIRIAFRLFTRRANRIISVSKTTAGLLAKRGMTSEVIYNTVDGFVASLPAAAATQPAGGIFHRGGVADHKNTPRVVAAFLAAKHRFPGVTLYVLGAANGAEVWKIGEDSDIIFLARQTDDELALLYASSRVVVAASITEGFGLPIIESFGFGTPVIASDKDPMREVAGDAALLVDPTDVAAIGDAIARVLLDPELARSLVEKGHVRARDFASGHIAQLHLEAYRKTAAG
jgi:glycosyltransferase involved in cell wall biosynthesis